MTSLQNRPGLSSGSELSLELAGLIALAIFGIAFYIAVRVWVERARHRDEDS